MHMAHGTKWRTAIYTAALMCAACPAAHADMGVPMLQFVWPASWVLLIPVILVEALVARRVFRLRFRQCLWIATAANAASTLAGIPGAWLGLVIVGTVFSIAWSILASLFPSAGWILPNSAIVVVQSPWLAPGLESDLRWMVPAAALVLCIPFFFMSVWLEAQVAGWKLGKERRWQVRKWAWTANGVTYGGIILWLIILTIRQLG